MPKIRDFLRTNHPTVLTTDTLESTVNYFMDTDSPEQVRAECLVVVGPDDRLVGLLNSWLVLRALAIGAEKEDEPAVDALMTARFELPVSSGMAETFPVAHPDDDLFSVLGRLGDDYYECIPVVAEGEYLGAVRTIDLFQAISEDVLGAASGGLFTE